MCICRAGIKPFIRRETTGRPARMFVVYYDHLGGTNVGPVELSLFVVKTLTISVVCLLGKHRNAQKIEMPGIVSTLSGGVPCRMEETRTYCT